MVHGKTSLQTGHCKRYRAAQGYRARVDDVIVGVAPPTDGDKRLVGANSEIVRSYLDEHMWSGGSTTDKHPRLLS